MNLSWTQGVHILSSSQATTTWMQAPSIRTRPRPLFVLSTPAVPGVPVGAVAAASTPSDLWLSFPASPLGNPRLGPQLQIMYFESYNTLVLTPCRGSRG
jgi:hypothetical protein